MTEEAKAEAKVYGKRAGAPTVVSVLRSIMEEGINDKETVINRTIEKTSKRG
jgi:hypothetical protein